MISWAAACAGERDGTAGEHLGPGPADSVTEAYATETQEMRKREAREEGWRRARARRLAIEIRRTSSSFRRAARGRGAPFAESGREERREADEL